MVHAKLLQASFCFVPDILGPGNTTREELSICSFWLDKLIKKGAAGRVKGCGEGKHLWQSVARAHELFWELGFGVFEGTKELCWERILRLVDVKLGSLCEHIA